MCSVRVDIASVTKGGGFLRRVNEYAKKIVWQFLKILLLCSTERGTGLATTLRL